MQNYSAIDYNPYVGSNYYRLKQTDLDGKYTYSHTISINNCNEDITEINIYPNPSKGIFNLVFTNGEERVYSICIYNSLGELVYYSNSFQSIIDLSNKPNGVYIVVIKLDSKNITKNIVVESQ